MRKIVYLALLLLLSVSCMQDENAMVPEPASGEISDAEMMASLNTEDFAPLNFLPEWAKEEMTEDEYDNWRILGSQVRVNYSFLKDERYDSYRLAINKAVEKDVQDILAGNPRDYKGFYTIIYPDVMSTPRVMTRAEGDGYNGRQWVLHRGNGFTCYVSISFLYVGGTYEVLSKGLSYDVEGVSYSGAPLVVSITPAHKAKVLLYGTFIYNHQSENVQINREFDMF